MPATTLTPTRRCTMRKIWLSAALGAATLLGLPGICSAQHGGHSGGGHGGGSSGGHGGSGGGHGGYYGGGHGGGYYGGYGGYGGYYGGWGLYGARLGIGLALGYPGYGYGSP